MARFVALVPARHARSFGEVLRMAIVFGCGLALIVAGRVLPAVTL